VADVSHAATAAPAGAAGWEPAVRRHAERLLDESRTLAADGRAEEALARLDEAICIALDSPAGRATSPDYLEWAAHLIAEADAYEEDLALIAASTVEGELIELPTIDSYPPIEVAEIDRPASLMPVSDYPLELNSTVLRFLDVMTQPSEYRSRIGIGLARGGAYLPMIRAKLESAGLPQDLSYLPLIESAFSTTAYSRARAHGMWQFISSTGRHYGLAVGSMLDERRDPERSTDAAIAYLADLYLEFEDWHLALAAYNSGAGNVRRAVRRSGSHDFWELQRYLPRETRNYVPAFIASVIVAKQPERFGFDPIVESEWNFDDVQVRDPLDLQFLASKLELDVADLRELNPAIRRDLTPAGRETDIRLPSGYGVRAQEVLASTPTSEWAPRLLHTVRRGETLSSIARIHGSTVADIRQANGIRGSLIHPGDTLIVPRFGSSWTPSPQPERRIAEGGTYVVQRNDTLWDIARSFGTSVDALAAANGLSRRDTIKPGQKLTIPSARSTAVAASSTSGATTYTVRRGDTLYDIARRFGVSVSDLRRANGLSGSRIHPGDVLHIPGHQARS
jgi:membrane-bound lytic murein transglycosylase D